jgi:glucosamine-6-phosphate deaminase
MIATIVRGESAFDRLAADQILKTMREKPDAVIGLSTGRTTGAMHRLVAESWKAAPFDISRITFFGQDEVTGVSPLYAGACVAMLRNEIIDPLGIDDDHFLMLPTRSDDFLAACRDFKAELDRRGGIDLLVLGLGENGHLGFNQPGSPFDGRTRVSVMYPELEERIRRETATPPEIPLGGVPLGLADIMEAKRILLVAKGRNKASIVRKIIKGPVTEAVPASILQNHPNCEYLLDHLAASHL